jgi:hypothetical protein
MSSPVLWIPAPTELGRRVIGIRCAIFKSLQHKYLTAKDTYIIIEFQISSQAPGGLTEVSMLFPQFLPINVGIIP